MKSKPPPVSKYKRSFEIGKTATKVIGKKLYQKSGNLFISEDKASLKNEELDKENAKLIFEALSKLRGTAVKIAQILANEMEYVPKNIRAELEKSYHQIPPINKALVLKILKNNYKDYKKTYSVFNLNAFAAASLGQVHTAEMNKKKLAVKIQYPGIKDTIKSDLKILSFLFKSIPDLKHATNIIPELEARLLEETDYIHEAQNNHFFKENLKIKNVIIPFVYQEISSDELLAMEFCEGESLSKWLLQNPSSNEKNKIANLLYQIFIKSLYDLKKIHSDPNPGNYIVDKDLNINLIDFGSTKSFNEDFLNDYSELTKSISNNDKKRYKDLLVSFNIFRTEKTNRINEIVDSLFLITQPIADLYKDEYYDFSKSPNLFKDNLSVMKEMRKYQRDLKMNPDFLFLDRTRYGLFRIFHQMGATVKIQNKFEV